MTENWFEQLIKEKQMVDISMRDDDGWCGIICYIDENGLTFSFTDKDGKEVFHWLPWDRIKEIEVKK